MGNVILLGLGRIRASQCLIYILRKGKLILIRSPKNTPIVYNNNNNNYVNKQKNV